jgi:hypothetical protein
MESALARLTGARVERLLRGEDVWPPATDSETETAAILTRAASFLETDNVIAVSGMSR